MKIVMITPNFHPYVGGAERQALELSRSLAQQGVSVTVLTREREGSAASETLEGFFVRRLPSRGFMAAVFLWLWGHSFEWDAAHVHLAGSHALPAALAGRMLQRSVFVKIGGGRGIGEIAASSRTFAGRLKWRVLAWLKPRCVAVTADIAAELAEYGIRLPVVVIPNGVDTGRFQPVPPWRKESLRQQALDWPPGLSFIYAGRLAPEKRLADFIEAFAEALRETGMKAHFLIAGEGSEEAGLRELAERLGVLDQSVHFRGLVADLEQRIYPLADVFVLPSESEGLSNALLEAMSCGLAVLASRVGGTAEAVADGASGLLFEPGDRKGMKAAIARVMSRPELAAELGAAGREAVLARFDLRRVAARYLELYRS